MNTLVVILNFHFVAYSYLKGFRLLPARHINRFDKLMAYFIFAGSTSSFQDSY